MVGADPTRCHNARVYVDKNWTYREALAAYNAEDVVKMDILAFLKKWDQIPVDKETAEKQTRKIKARDPNGYFERGDEVLHPQIGFGIVQDAILYDRWTQKLYVLFENHTEGVIFAKDLCKVREGKILAAGPRKG